MSIDKINYLCHSDQSKFFEKGVIVLINSDYKSAEKSKLVIRQIVARYDTGIDICVIITNKFDLRAAKQELFIGVYDESGQEFVGRVHDLIWAVGELFFRCSYPPGYLGNHIKSEDIIFFCEINKTEMGTRILVAQ